MKSLIVALLFFLTTSAVQADMMLYGDRSRTVALATNGPNQWAGAPVRPGYGSPRHGNIIPTDIETLKGIGQRAFGPPPNDTRDYTAHVTPTVAPPARGCTLVNERGIPGAGTLDRWRCPPGTIRRLGW